MTDLVDNFSYLSDNPLDARDVTSSLPPNTEAINTYDISHRVWQTEDQMFDGNSYPKGLYFWVGPRTGGDSRSGWVKLLDKQGEIDSPKIQALINRSSQVYKTETEMRYDKNLDPNKIYVTLDTQKVYIYNEGEFYSVGGEIPIDDVLDSNSVNPVQNKVVVAGLDTKLNKTSIVNQLDIDDATRPLSSAMGKKLQDEKAPKDLANAEKDGLMSSDSFNKINNLNGAINPFEIQTYIDGTTVFEKGTSNTVVVNVVSRNYELKVTPSAASSSASVSAYGTEVIPSKVRFEKTNASGTTIGNPDGDVLDKVTKKTYEEIKEDTRFTTKVEYINPSGVNIKRSDSASVSFVYPKFYGIIDKKYTAKIDPNVEGEQIMIDTAKDVILGLRKSISGGKSFSDSGISFSDQKYCYAYPKEYGVLSQIKDGNTFDVAFNYIDTVTLELPSIVGDETSPKVPVEYRVYVKVDAVTQTNASLNFR